MNSLLLMESFVVEETPAIPKLHAAILLSKN
jgi:hypothetical protein